MIDWARRAGMERVVTDPTDARELQEMSPKRWNEALGALTSAIVGVVQERGISNYDAQRLLRQIADEVQTTFMPCWACRKIHTGQMPCGRSVIEKRYGGVQ